MADPINKGSEEESRRVAEESREQEWAGRTFLRAKLPRQLPLDIIQPFPTADRRPEFRSGTASSRTSCARRSIPSRSTRAASTPRTSSTACAGSARSA